MQVVSEVCQWMQQLSVPQQPQRGGGGGSGGGGGGEEPSMACEDIRKLFDINLEGPAVRSLAVHVKEMASVPPTLADDARAPMVSRPDDKHIYTVKKKNRKRVKGGK